MNWAQTTLLNASPSPHSPSVRHAVLACESCDLHVTKRHWFISMNSMLRAKLTAAVLLAVSCSLAHAAAPPNAVNYTNLGKAAATACKACEAGQ